MHRRVRCCDHIQDHEGTPQEKKRLLTKAVKGIETANANGGVLPDDQATNFRALAARANYLSLDRPELAYASKELCRAFARPTTTGVKALKHLVRYLVHHSRLSYISPWGDYTNVVDVFVGTDFAGCKRTRRSTSGGVIRVGSCTLKHWSVTRSTIALSSGEAELGGDR